MRGIFKHILCAGFLISLVGVGAARAIASLHANDQVAQDTDPKTQEPPSDPTWILTGKIGGKYALRMEVRRKDDQLSGRYRYANKPKAGYLVLRGAIDKSGSAELSEYDASDKKTGTFKGSFTGEIIGQNSPTKFAGAWTNANTAESFEFGLSAETAKKIVHSDAGVLEDRVDITMKQHTLMKKPDSALCDNCYYNQPLITGKQPPQVLRKIRQALDIETVFGDTIESLREDLYEIDDQGKSVPNRKEMSIDYEVGYNENYILSFIYRKELSGRPYTIYERRVIDLKTGNVVKAQDVFMPNSIPALAKMVDQRLQKTLKSQLAAYRDGTKDDEEYNALKEVVEEQSFTEDSLDDFTVDYQGVTFYYDYGGGPFFGILGAAELPNGEVFKFSFEELKDYINPKGMLGQFISK
jgi:hypothetical protein